MGDTQPLAFNLTLHIHLPTTGGAPVVSPEGGAAPPAERTLSGLLGRSPAELLTLCNVRAPLGLLHTYPADRIREVCLAGLARQGQIKNLGGWVASALRKGWDVCRVLPDVQSALSVPAGPGVLTELSASSPGSPAPPGPSSSWSAPSTAGVGEVPMSEPPAGETLPDGTPAP